MSTTLFTFRIDAPPEAWSIELRGSWDNFTHSYRMERDQRRGAHHWCGCFTFKDVICDGADQTVLEKREGGLKMGETYWYYYTLNGNYEWADPNKPSTTACPLLLGETLNILEVPFEESDYSLDIPVFSLPPLSAAFTMDPGARFTTPRPNKFEALARKPLPPVPVIGPATALHDSKGGLHFKPLSPISGRSLRSSASSSNERSPRRAPSVKQAQFLGRQIRSAGSSRTQLESKADSRNEPCRKRPSSMASVEAQQSVPDRKDSPVESHGSVDKDENRRRETVESEDTEPLTPQPVNLQDDEVLSDSGATIGYSCCAWKTRSRPTLQGNAAKDELMEAVSQRLCEWIADTLDLEDQPLKEDSADIDQPNQLDSLQDASNFFQEEDPFEGIVQDHDKSHLLDGVDSLSSGWPLHRVSGYYEHPEEETGLEERFSDIVLEPKVEDNVDQELDASRMPSLELDTSQTSSTEHLMGTCVGPPLLTQSLDIASPADKSWRQSLSPVASPQASDISSPQVAPSLVYSPTCSSPDTTWLGDTFSSLDSISNFSLPHSKPQTHDSPDPYHLDLPSPVVSPSLLPIHSHFGHFQGYSLPTEYTASEATLTKVSTTQTTCTILMAESPVRRERHNVGRGLEALETQINDMEELMSDFGYLGEAVL